MNKNVRIILIVGAVAIAGYLAYRWWQNRSSGSGGSLGANLNSAAPELVGGSTGPNSGLNYYAGSTPITIDLPNGNQSQNDTGNQGDDGDTDHGVIPGEPCPIGTHRVNGKCVPNKHGGKGGKLPITRTHTGGKIPKGGKKTHTAREGNFTPGGSFP